MDDPKRRDVAEQLNNYSSELKKLHKFTAAAIALERAIEILPDSGTLWSNLGAVKWSQNDFVTAEKCMMKALELGYDNDKINCNLGLLMSSMNRWDEAEKYFQRSMSQAPEEHLAEWEDSLTCLDKGDWINGFKKYDIRRQIKKEYNALKYPFWNGEDLNGKTIYIQAEQGLGDRFLFHRYLYWLKEKYPTVKILYLCDSALHNLFWELKLATGLEFIPNKVPWPKADYGQYLMNLPRFHGTTPDNVYPDPGLIRKRVEPYKNACNLPAPELSSLKVGICWTGNPVMEQNIQRSVPLEMMLELAKDSKVVLYNFQVGKEGSDAINNLGADGLICDIGPGLEKKVGLELH